MLYAIFMKIQLLYHVENNDGFKSYRVGRRIPVKIEKPDVNFQNILFWKLNSLRVREIIIKFL